MASAVETLIELGADPLARKTGVARSSARKKMRNALRSVRGGAQGEEEDETRTPLHALRDECWAVMDTTRQIMESRARIECALGVPPLHVAVGRGDLVSVTGLLAKGADVDEEDASGSKPLALVRLCPVPLATQDATTLGGHEESEQALRLLD